MDTGSDCTLVTRYAVNRTITTSHEIKIISIHGIADELTTVSDKYATLDIEFGSEIITRGGLIVNSICFPISWQTPVPMTNKKHSVNKGF